MQILVNQNSQQLGPYSIEQVRDLVYRGELRRESLACAVGGQDWCPLDQLLDSRQPTPPAVAPPVAVPPAAAPPVVGQAVTASLRDPKEPTALLWLYIAAVPAWLVLVLWTVASMGAILPIIGLIVLGVLMGELWFAAYVKTNAVRLSRTQLPELYRVVENCCQKLQMPVPDVYILQQNVWNAFATKILGRRMVVLLSGAVDSILLKGDLQQMAWLVGHELGHHRAGHLDFPRRLAQAGSWCIWVRLWYSRRAELTCDRMGLYCAGSLRSSRLALLNATVGAQLAGQVNVAEAIGQWRLHRDEFFVRYRTLYSTHPHHLARLDHLNAVAPELGVS